MLQLPAADTPITSSWHPALTMVRKALLNSYSPSCGDPDSMAEKPEDVRCAFCPSKLVLLIRNKSKNMSARHQMPKAFLLMHSPLFHVGYLDG